MTISIIQTCSVLSTANTQRSATTTRGFESASRNISQDTISLSEEAVRLSQEHNKVAPSEATHAQAESKPLEHYQLPDWFSEVGTSHLLYEPKNDGNYAPVSSGAIEYGNTVMTAFRNALNNNGINSDNYYEDFIKNSQTSLQVKNDVYSQLQQDSKAMQLMRIYNPSLYQQLNT